MKYRARIVFSERNPVYKGIVERFIRGYIMLNDFLFFTGACKRCRCRSSGRLRCARCPAPRTRFSISVFLYLWMDGWLVLPGKSHREFPESFVPVGRPKIPLPGYSPFQKDSRTAGIPATDSDSAKTKHPDGMRNLSPVETIPDLLSGNVTAFFR